MQYHVILKAMRSFSGKVFKCQEWWSTSGLINLRSVRRLRFPQVFRSNACTKVRTELRLRLAALCQAGSRTCLKAVDEVVHKYQDPEKTEGRDHMPRTAPPKAESYVWVGWAQPHAKPKPYIYIYSICVYSILPHLRPSPYLSLPRPRHPSR